MALTFAVDVMLGRLARWLRIVGCDVVYGSHLHGRGLVACARRDGRTIVTRDTRLVRDPNLPPHVFVRSDRFREQLREVAAAVPLPLDAAFTRCVECNVPLAEIARDAVADRIPSYVLATQSEFHTCPSCRRIYWRATHHVRMRAEMAALGWGDGSS